MFIIPTFRQTNICILEDNISSSCGTKNHQINPDSGQKDTTVIRTITGSRSKQP